MMTKHEWVEHQSGMWTLRAVLSKAVRIDDSGPQDVWVWYVSLGDDEWFAHGVSNEISFETRQAMFDGIEGEIMDIMLAYAGEPWETILESPVGIGNMHRAVLNGMPPGLMSDLKRMSRSEILSLRSAEERGFGSL